MNVLFMASNNPNYMSDLLIHGFIKLGHEVYLSSEKNYLFKYNQDEENITLYGKGFTYSKILESKDKKVISSRNIAAKVKDNYFDIIIYSEYYTYQKMFTKISNSKNIVVINSFAKSFNLTHKELFMHVLTSISKFSITPELSYAIHKRKIEKKSLKNEILYFTRYNIKNNSSLPIQLCIPREKITHIQFKKTYLISKLIPGIPSTYIFDTEEDYYSNYQKSFFGFTFKKFGWDSLRHYEILANNCIPYFPDIDECPEFELFLFPKDIIKRTNLLLENFSLSFPLEEWKEAQIELHNYTCKFLTTEYLSNYVIEMMIKRQILNENIVKV